MSYNEDYSETEENVGLGILGAFLFALIGVIVFVGLYWINIFPPLAGIFTVSMAIVGFRLFAKKPSLKSIFISIVVAIAVAVLAEYITLAVDAYYAYADWYATGEASSPITLGQAFLYGYQFLAEPSILSYYLKEFLLTALFCVLGSALFIADGVKLYRAQKDY